MPRAGAACRRTLGERSIEKEQTDPYAVEMKTFANVVATSRAASVAFAEGFNSTYAELLEWCMRFLPRPPTQGCPLGMLEQAIASSILASIA